MIGWLLHHPDPCNGYNTPSYYIYRKRQTIPARGRIRLRLHPPTLTLTTQPRQRTRLHTDVTSSTATPHAHEGDQRKTKFMLLKPHAPAHASQLRIPYSSKTRNTIYSSSSELLPLPSSPLLLLPLPSSSLLLALAASCRKRKTGSGMGLLLRCVTISGVGREIA